MKVILPGYDASKRIIAPASWLLSKYLPDEFDIYWLNYGNYKGTLHRGTYVSLDVMQFGGALSWSKYILDFLNTIDDELVILGLDDYFITDHINMNLYEMIRDSIGGIRVCGRLFNPFEMTYKEADEKPYLIADDAYSCTAQYCIWNKRVLEEVLGKVNSPWEFEKKGSRYITDDTKYVTIGVKQTILPYETHSVLSPKWEGLKCDSLNPKDFRELRDYGYI